MTPSSASRPASPVDAEVKVVRPPAAEADEKGRRHAVTTLTVGEDETVFPGHYPGFPIFPGVCVIECVHLSGLATLPPGAGGAELAAVESTRFLSPVFPGDQLDVELTWTRTSDAWSCKAQVTTVRGVAAQMRLRFTAEETA
ncbi:3-hydroxyacyl-ACP dehydratase FabZ family protein [Streptomyces sp. NBRC 109706]|uniref:3-hydroxyacyl-ACP dehydratase FabZ family protein n=1 Tax=Streptomyces sp. NBRC 109706 TaxID=1550035 RepID=UPI00078428B3|nr:3-hydroxyacyl-ACP dehydratase FabZ family protein [Streptomyces sp. NBRC 109706]